MNDSVSVYDITKMSLRSVEYSGVETAAEGAITVQPLVRDLDGFESYFRSLRPDTNLRNPWFSEYWQEFFKYVLLYAIVYTIYFSLDCFTKKMKEHLN